MPEGFLKDIRSTNVFGKSPKQDERSYQRDYKRKERLIKKKKKELEEAHQNEKRWVAYKYPEEEWAELIEWSKLHLGIFMRQTKRQIDLPKIRWHMDRRGQNVLDVIRDATGRSSRSWIQLCPKPEGHHPLLNRGDLRKICQAIGVPYYREMTVDEQRAVLILLADMGGMDPRKEIFD